MIKLNGVRKVMAMDDVLSELDAFDKGGYVNAVPFTVFIADVSRTPEDPFIVQVKSPDEVGLQGAIETAYFYGNDCGNDDGEFQALDINGDSIGDYWQHKGACVIGLVHGQHDVVWNPDGCGHPEWEAAFRVAQGKKDADPFKETYRSAWISTAHLTPETLNYLNALPSDMLPFWMCPTLYGWIVRFDALDTIGLAEEGEEESRELSECADLMAIKAALYEHGYQAAHLDADGPVIEGLASYDHV